MTLPPPDDDRALHDLLGMRELFRDEARAIVERLRRRLPELEGALPDPGGLGDVVADGVALKGSGALVGLPVVSRAGVFIVRAAELAAERAAADAPRATGVIKALGASLGVLERLLDVCLDADDGVQERVLAEVLEGFAAEDRSLLRRTLDGPVATSAEAEAVAGIVGALTELLLADTQLAGVDRELHELLGALPAENAAWAADVAAALAARAAPARALARSAAVLHRWVRTLDPAATPLERVVLVHVGDACYGLAADDVESVVEGATVADGDDTGRATLLNNGDPLPALDLGRYLGSIGAAPGVAAVLHADDGRMALLVARAEPPRLMVLRPLDAPLSRHPLSRAATVGARGEVVLVLRTDGLLEAVRGGLGPSTGAVERSVRG